MRNRIRAMKTRLAVLQRRLRGVKKRLLWIVVDPGVKRRVFLVFVAFGLGSSLAWHFFSDIMALLMVPAGGQLSPTGRPIFTSPTDMFGVKVEMAMRAGIVVALPVLVYHVARLFSPLLNKQQLRFIALFLPATFACYIIGAAFAYFVLLPAGLGFLLSYGTDVADPMIRITDYMDLVYTMIVWLGIVFELPLAMFLLAKMRIVEYQRFKALRRFVPATAFIFGALITPTMDIINSTLVAVPLILLYEAGVFLAWLARPRGKGKVG